MFETSYPEIIAIIQVVFIDLVLAGDNAIVVGMAAASVQTEYRKKVIIFNEKERYKMWEGEETSNSIWKINYLKDELIITIGTHYSFYCITIFIHPEVL